MMVLNEAVALEHDTDGFATRTNAVVHIVRCMFCSAHIEMVRLITFLILSVGGESLTLRSIGRDVNYASYVKETKTNSDLQVVINAFLIFEL
ncbi:hypothetical protein QVD17_09687 [Tagetes erecta]|uniref:Uncharacterized protein n=1 Tax=Tagetes erecta TaxID=13708 RepID=A0AAD8L128_TARER|nr:hypothetical protein QVD17_09687 [Tagetes erecta]